jgi:hypothetical protein
MDSVNGGETFAYCSNVSLYRSHSESTSALRHCLLPSVSLPLVSEISETMLSCIKGKILSAYTVGRILQQCFMGLYLWDHKTD